MNTYTDIYIGQMDSYTDIYIGQGCLGQGQRSTGHAISKGYIKLFKH